MDNVIELISKLGFPIACVIALFWAQQKERDDHKAETEKFVEAINNNTLVLTELKTLWKAKPPD